MIAEFSIVSLGEGKHLSDMIADVLRLVEESGLPYRLHAMGTNVEGSWDDVMGLIRRCHECAAERCERIYTQIKIDDFRGRTDALTAKITAVEKKLGKPLKD
jgi:uncharacterized protein (TIGR00106 family)